MDNQEEKFPIVDEAGNVLTPNFESEFMRFSNVMVV